MTPAKQALLDALTAERFTPCPERPADNSDGPSAQVELAARVVRVEFGRRSA